MRDETKERIKYWYSMGFTYEEIAVMANISKATVTRYISEFIGKGEITRRQRNEITRNDDGTYYCNTGTCRSCVYGAKKSTTECNYMIKTGHRRGCSPRACDKFIKGDPLKIDTYTGRFMKPEVQGVEYVEEIQTIQQSMR